MSTTPLNDVVRKPVKQLDISFTVANGIGIVIFLLLASRAWRLPGESDLPVTGEPMVWSIALPVLGVFFLANIVWGTLILRSKEFKRWRGWLVTAVFWLFALAVDNFHH